MSMLTTCLSLAGVEDGAEGERRKSYLTSIDPLDNGSRCAWGHLVRMVFRRKGYPTPIYAAVFSRNHSHAIDGVSL